MHACKRGLVEMVTELLNQGANIEDHDVCGLTALIKSVKSGNVELVVLLLSRGADVNASSSDG